MGGSQNVVDCVGRSNDALPTRRSRAACQPAHDITCLFIVEGLPDAVSFLLVTLTNNG